MMAGRERAWWEAVGHAMHEIIKHALRLRQRGVVPLPLREGGKHLDLSQMGYEPVHLSNKKKLLKELAFRGIAFHLSQRPPDQSTVEGWFSSEKVNIGILGGFGDEATPYSPASPPERMGRPNEGSVTNNIWNIRSRSLGSSWRWVTNRAKASRGAAGSRRMPQSGSMRSGSIE